MPKPTVRAREEGVEDRHVERVELMAFDDVVLHRDDDIDKDVVAGLGLDLYVELLHPSK